MVAALARRPDGSDFIEIACLMVHSVFVLRGEMTAGSGEIDLRAGIAGF